MSEKPEISLIKPPASFVLQHYPAFYNDIQGSKMDLSLKCKILKNHYEPKKVCKYETKKYEKYEVIIFPMHQT
jgi:hypothetical protein